MEESSCREELDQDGNFDEIFIKEENDLDFINDIVKHEEDHTYYRDEGKEQDPLEEMQLQSEEDFDEPISRKPMWRHRDVLKMLQVYKRYLPLIRTGGIHRNTLWLNIGREMQANGCRFDGPACNRKMRNLKCRYRIILLNNKMTTRGHSRWEYLEAMENIFGDILKSSTRESSRQIDSASPRPSTSTYVESEDKPPTPSDPLTPASERTVSCPGTPTYITPTPSPSACASSSEKADVAEPSTAAEPSSIKKRKLSSYTDVLSKFLTDQSSRLDKLVDIAEHRNKILEKCMNQMMQNQQRHLQKVELIQQQQQRMQEKQQERLNEQERLQEQQKQQYEEMLTLQRQQFMLLRQQMRHDGEEAQ